MTVTMQVPLSTILPGRPMTVIFTVLICPFSVCASSMAGIRSSHKNGGTGGGAWGTVAFFDLWGVLVEACSPLGLSALDACFFVFVRRGRWLPRFCWAI